MCRKVAQDLDLAPGESQRFGAVAATEVLGIDADPVVEADGFGLFDADLRPAQDRLDPPWTISSSEVLAVSMMIG